MIAGKFKGRRITFESHKDVRPAMNRVREAVYSWLSCRFMRQHAFTSGSHAFDSLNVLDIFSGTGSYGFEALSRGAALCTFCEQGSIQQQWIRHSASVLGVSSQIHIHGGKLPSSMKTLPESPPFHCVFIGPPYKNISLGEEALCALLPAQVVPETWAFLECGKGYTPKLQLGSWHLKEARKCGPALLCFYHQNENI
jgi:16S rRNA (guanine966-N2)-methyltransferase